jgi:hypothetical protein
VDAAAPLFIGGYQRAYFVLSRLLRNAIPTRAQPRNRAWAGRARAITERMRPVVEVFDALAIHKKVESGTTCGKPQIR